MSIDDFDSWRQELLFTRDIVQDADTSVSPEEAEERFNRYVELVRMVAGDEGPEVVATLIESMITDQDYGAYQSTHAALAHFPLTDLAHGIINAAPILRSLGEDRAGELLLPVALASSEVVQEFNDRLTSLESTLRDVLVAIIKAQESAGGWLDSDRACGRLAPER